MRLNHATKAIAVTAVIVLAAPTSADARGSTGGGGRSAGSSAARSTNSTTSTSSSRPTSRPSTRRTESSAQRRKRQEKIRDRLDYDDTTAPSASGLDSAAAGGAAPRNADPKVAPAAERMSAITQQLMRYMLWLITGLVALIGVSVILRLTLGFHGGHGGGGGAAGYRSPTSGGGSRPTGGGSRTGSGGGWSDAGSWGDSGCGGGDSSGGCGGGGD